MTAVLQRGLAGEAGAPTEIPGEPGGGPSGTAPQGTTVGIALPPPIPWPRRIFKHPRLMHYNRLAAAVVTANLALLWALGTSLDLRLLGCAALGNFALAVLIRQQYVINLLFRLATSAPTRWCWYACTVPRYATR